MGDKDKIEFMIEHIGREIELEERQIQFESITPESADDVLLIEKEDGSQEIISAGAESLESNNQTSTTVGDEKDWVNQYDNKKELLEVLTEMDTKIKEGEDVNEVAL